MALVSGYGTVRAEQLPRMERDLAAHTTALETADAAKWVNRQEHCSTQPRATISMGISTGPSGRSPSLGSMCAQMLLFFVRPKYARAVLRADASVRCARCDAAPCGPQAGTTARGVL